MNHKFPIKFNTISIHMGVNLKQSIRMMIFIIITCLFQTNSFARTRFGDIDKIKFVADTSLTAPGERLFLGRRTASHFFIINYSGEDMGYVLGVSGNPSKFYPLPAKEELSRLQKLGYLPDPLPRYDPDFEDYMDYHPFISLMAAVLIFFCWLKFKEKYL